MDELPGLFPKEPLPVPDAVPRVAHGVAIELPVVGDGVSLLAPLRGQLVLELLERPVFELRTARALPAVAIRGLVIRKSRPGAVMRPQLILIAPVGGFLPGIELRDEAVAGDRADRRARCRADDRSNRTAHRGACRRPGDPRAHGPDGRSHPVSRVLLLSGFTFLHACLRRNLPQGVCRESRT